MRARQPKPRSAPAICAIGPQIERHRLGAVRQTFTDQVVPAIGGRFLPGLPAADVEPIFGPGHGDIEQAAIFLVLSRLERAAGARCGGTVERAAQRPDHEILVFEPQEARAGARHLHRIGQEDNRRLEPFRTVHGHHANRVLSMLQVTLDLRRARGEPVQEALQRGHVLALMGEREGEKLVDRVGRLGSEPGQESGPTAAGAEQLGVELIGSLQVGSSAQLHEAAVALGKVGVFLLGSPPGARATASPRDHGQREKLRLAQAKEGAFEDGGQGQVVSGRSRTHPAQSDP